MSSGGEFGSGYTEQLQAYLFKNYLQFVYFQYTMYKVGYKHFVLHLLTQREQEMSEKRRGLRTVYVISKPKYLRLPQRVFQTLDPTIRCP